MVVINLLACMKGKEKQQRSRPKEELTFESPSVSGSNAAVGVASFIPTMLAMLTCAVRWQCFVEDGRRFVEERVREKQRC